MSMEVEEGGHSGNLSAVACGGFLLAFGGFLAQLGGDEEVSMLHFIFRSKRKLSSLSIMSGWRILEGGDAEDAHEQEPVGGLSGH